MPETSEIKLTREAQCFRCRELKPDGNFRRNAAGVLTAWCESCRKDAARKWSVEEDLVELVYGLYVYECVLRNEARVVADSNVQTGRESPASREMLESNLRKYDMAKHHRIPVRLGSFLRHYRQDFFNGVSMAEPEITILELAEPGR